MTDKFRNTNRNETSDRFFMILLGQENPDKKLIVDGIEKGNLVLLH